MSAITLAAKDPDVATEYAIDFEDALVSPLERDTYYGLNAIVRPVPGNGWYYVVTDAGRTGQFWPSRLPRAADETVQDGSAALTAKHPSSVTLPSIQSATWTVPSDLTIESQAETGFVAKITLSGGTGGEDYDLVCRMTATSGLVREQTITVPVRSQ